MKLNNSEIEALRRWHTSKDYEAQPPDRIIRKLEVFLNGANQR